jgi:hypothetical protein
VVADTTLTPAGGVAFASPARGEGILLLIETGLGPFTVALDTPRTGLRDARLLALIDDHAFDAGGLKASISERHLVLQSTRGRSSSMTLTFPRTGQAFTLTTGDAARTTGRVMSGGEVIEEIIAVAASYQHRDVAVLAVSRIR